MGLNPSIHEQELIAEALERRVLPLSDRERRAELVVSGGFVVAVIVLLVAIPPALAFQHPLAAVVCFVALVVAARVEFDMGSGWTVPTQLAFVPMLFAMPPALVPLAVLAALVIAKLPDVARGRLQPARLLRFPANAWFSIGPAVVLSCAGASDASSTTPAVLLCALAAQLVSDFAGSATVERLLRGASLREQLHDAWVYGVDVALSPVGLVLAWHLDETPWAPLAVVPLLAVLMVFGRERRRRVEGLVELNNAYRGTAMVLGDVVEADDGYTGEHSRGVLTLALDVGCRLGLDAERLRNLEFGALLHDVGKVAIPKEIINKPGKLDPHEWRIIKTHTIEGQRMLDQVGGFMSHVGRIVRSHHERWDGGGYPDGLSGEKIPLEARIVSACDTWNAMTTTRPYRKALPTAVAAAELRECAGAQLDPTVVDALLASVAAGEASSDEAPGVLVESRSTCAPGA